MNNILPLVNLAMLMVTFTFNACIGSEDPKPETGSTVNVIFEHGNTDTEMLIRNPEMQLKVYGSAYPFSDKLIVSETYEVAQIPFAVSLSFPESPHLLVDSSLSAGDVTFYVATVWDTDDNGKICAGDLIVDVNPLSSGPLVDPYDTAEQLIYLSTLSSNEAPCNYRTCENDCLTVEISLEGPENVSILNPAFDVSVYGYDIGLADVPDRLIVYERLEVDRLPATVYLKVPENARDSVLTAYYSEVVVPDDYDGFRYYLRMRWDSDDNGNVCTGDLKIDANRKFPDIDLYAAGKQTIYLTEDNTTPCD